MARPLARRLRGLRWLVALLPACGAPPDAAPSAPITPTASPAPLGYAPAASLVGGDVALLPPPAGTGAGFPVGVNGRNVLYLNFEGAELWTGNDPQTQAGIRGKMSAEMLELPPYQPKDADRYAKILQVHKLVAGFYADFNIDVVLSRPLSGNFQMTVVGGDKADLGYGGSVVGISPGDCGNRNPADVNYAFSANLSGSVIQTAVTAAHEAGHAFGLGHTQNMKDIMFPSVQTPSDIGFATGEAADPGVCNVMQGYVQDGKKILTENLGARPENAKIGQGAPTVAFTSVPDQSADLLAGKAPDPTAVPAYLVVAVKAAAKSGIDHVTISVSPGEGSRYKGGFAVAELRPPDAATQIQFSSAGEYLLQAAAYDREGNVATAYSRIKVATPTCKAPNDCSPGQQCTDNVCVTPMPPPVAAGDDKVGTRPLGTTCTGTNECAGPGALCAITPIGQLCTHYCSDGRRCAGGLSCVDGICLPPTVKRGAPEATQIGARCTRSTDCGAGLECSPANEADPTAPRYCTRECNGNVAWTCPADMVCQSTTGASGVKDRCVLGNGATPKGGCQVTPGAAPTSSGGALAALGLLGLCVLSDLRRRSRAA